MCWHPWVSHVTAWNNPVRNVLRSILMTFRSLLSRKVTRGGVCAGGGCKTRAGFLCCNFNDNNNHWQSVRFFRASYLSRSRWNRRGTGIFFSFLWLRLSEPLTQPMVGGRKKRGKRKGRKKKTTLTASDSVSFQSARIRFITFLSLHLVDASRVRLHWYGRGGLSCDYDIFLGALSSHSISLG